MSNCPRCQIVLGSPQKPCALSNPNMFAKRVSRTSLSALYMAKVMIQCEKMKYLHWISRQVLNAQKPRLPFFFREHPYNISLLTRGNIENRWWKICNIENLYWKKLSKMWWKNQHYETTGDGKISIKIVIFHLYALGLNIALFALLYIVETRFDIFLIFNHKAYFRCLHNFGWGGDGLWGEDRSW